MKKQPDLLRNLRVASPCHVGWDRMNGDDRVRFCDSCNRHVYNLSDLTDSEITSLITKSEGGICGRLRRRADGTILTRDCPVGLRAFRRRVARFGGAVFATILAACSIVFSQSKGTLEPFVQKEIKIERSKSEKEQIGKFKGRVVDTNGAVIVGAEVNLRNPFDNKRKTVFTDDTGVFTFSNVKDGRYMLHISAPGFTSFRTNFIEIRADEFASTEITLQVSTPETTMPATTMGFVISTPEFEYPNGTTVIRPNKLNKLPINN